jgi:hypothetical protein
MKLLESYEQILKSATHEKLVMDDRINTEVANRQFRCRQTNVSFHVTTPTTQFLPKVRKGGVVSKWSVSKPLELSVGYKTNSRSHYAQILRRRREDDL